MSVPSSPSASFGSYDVPRARRPGGLTAICVIGIVLGSLGVLGSLAGIAGLVAGPRLQEAMMPPAGPGGNKSIEIQRTMQKKMQAVTDRYRWPNGAFALMNLGLATSMLAGAVMALKRGPKARALLITVFAVAIPFEILRTVVLAFMQWETSAVVSDMLPRMMAVPAPVNGPQAQQAAAMASAVAKASVVAGIAFLVIFSVAKLSYYAIGWFYLRRPVVRHWFSGADEGLLTLDEA